MPLHCKIWSVITSIILFNNTDYSDISLFWHQVKKTCNSVKDFCIEMVKIETLETTVEEDTTGLPAEERTFAAIPTDRTMEVEGHDAKLDGHLFGEDECGIWQRTDEKSGEQEGWADESWPESLLEGDE
jgi:hypothetical protein